MAAPEADYLGQELDIELIRAVMPFVGTPFFVDVGAERGSFASAMFSHGMRGVLIEPLERHRLELEGLAAAHQSSVLPYAIDETDGERELFIATDTAGRELDFFHSLHELKNDSRFMHSKRVRVTCRSIGSLVTQGIIPPAVGILKTDTEGNDLFVLKGLGGLRPELVICEYLTEGLYSGWESARPELAIDLMREKGYSRYVATKRIHEFEYCGCAPAGFLPGHWGNLFFFSNRLYAVCERQLTRFMNDTERRFISQVQAMASDRIAKEAVIQALLASTRATGAS